MENPWKISNEREENEEEKKEKSKSNIGYFLGILKDIMAFFEATQNGIEKANSQIAEKYPKHLSKLALFSLQMDDFLFREIFILQILIFTQSVTDPVSNEHKQKIILSSAEEKAA